MIFLTLAMKSLRNRALATTLTIFSIALSVTLLLTVERAQRAAREGFTQSISQTDLIVGARSGPLQLILYTVFNMGNATHNISYETYEDIKKNPAIEWTIPYSLGDGHRGFRVVGTNEDFFKHYRYRGQMDIQLQSGEVFKDLWDVVIGSEVEKTLRYNLGDKIVIAHGVTRGEGIQKHDDKPFRVVGIMKPTGTPIDRAVYIRLEGLEAVHIDWQSGAAPQKDQVIPASSIHAEDLKIHTITAFFLRTKTRIETLRLQRTINEYKTEPLLAIIPGVVLSELWQNLSYVEKVLKMISLMVVSVGLMSMLIALTTTLNERRREMAILRSIGAKQGQILSLLVFESALLTFAGIVLGSLISVGGVFILAPWLETEFGLSLGGPIWTSTEMIYLAMTFVAGVAIGFIPAFRALNAALKDGLSVRV